MRDERPDDLERRVGQGAGLDIHSVLRSLAGRQEQKTRRPDRKSERRVSVMQPHYRGAAGCLRRNIFGRLRSQAGL